ncbi:MAG: DCC1-like thiol-disulfide oxidoreductase family protein [Candidatus Glassbacteria bacterium]
MAAESRLSGEKPEPMVLFDGFCNLCGGFASWLVRRDRRGRFRLTPLQGETAGKLLSACKDSIAGTDTIVLVEDGRCFTRSTAVLRILKRLPRPWAVFYLLIAVPRPVRDFVYDIIAKLRYRLFGRRDKCYLPENDPAGRFLP